MRKESFVFHAEYLDDLPEDYKPVFAMYIFNYAIYGTEPELSGLEITIWAKIKRRIDYDYNEWLNTKNERTESGRIGGIKSGISRRSKRSNASNNEAQLQAIKQNEAMLQNVQKNEANEAVYVSVNEFVNEYEFERENEQKKEEEQEKQNISLSPKPVLEFNIPQNYAKQVFDILSENQLPCCFNNFITFMQTDFKRALETLHGPNLKGFHSDMILGALKNYAQVVNNPNTWQGWKNKKSFDRFVSWDRFWDFLPDRFCLDNFLDRSAVSPPKQQNKGVGLNRALEILEEVQNEKKRVHG